MNLAFKNCCIFDEAISLVYEKLKFHSAFLNGKYRLKNSDSMKRDSAEVNWLIAWNSPCAFDVLVSETMGFEQKTTF